MSIQKSIKEYLEAYSSIWPFSGTVLVAKENTVIHRQSYGMANHEHSVPNKPIVKYSIGSLTKQFTAAAVMILVDRGLLHVEERISKYFKDHLYLNDQITIHHLLTHTSGLIDIKKLNNFKGKLDKLKLSQAEFINLFCDENLVCKPGEDWHYSGIGYYLLGMIIEEVSGTTYKDFISENIFKPLGMYNSGCVDNSKIILNKANGYSMDGDELVNAEFFEPSNRLSVGGVYSTVDDLLIWDTALYTNKILSYESVNQLFHPHVRIGSNNLTYGYGYYRSIHLNRICYGHSGLCPGWLSVLRRYPEEKLFINLLYNYDFIHEFVISDTIASIVIGESYTIPTKPTEITVLPEQLESYVGTYETQEPNSDFSINVILENGSLYIQKRNNKKVKVIPISLDTFQHPFVEEEQYQFNRDESGSMCVWGCKRMEG